MQSLLDFLEESKHLKITVLTGAGISAESGIKTFRDNNGLWETHPVEEVATPMAFEQNPDLVYEFYNQRRAQLLTCKPNEAHKALGELEGKINIITQNVDNLHELGGSTAIHMHGELLKVRCTSCETVFDWIKKLDSTDKCAKCSSKMRPHIVWFHEMPFFMDEIQRLTQDSNLFVAIGTSGHVYPAAGLSQLAKRSGAFTLEINLERTSVDFESHLEGPATKKVREFVNMISKYDKF
jgi:NAD-dependent deacetylase